MTTFERLKRISSYGFFLTCLSAAVVAGYATTACAQISVDKVILTFGERDQPVRNVLVRNAAPTPMFVVVTATKVLNAGLPDESIVPSDEILVAPKRFSVPARGERTVRLLLKKKPETAEQAYRLSFIPEARDTSDEEKAAEKGKTTLRVLTGVGILVFAQPRMPEPKLVWERTADKLIFRNEGNVNVFVDKIIPCKTGEAEADPKVCPPLPPKRLYAGNTYTVNAKSSVPITFRKKELDNSSTVTVP